MPKYVGSGTFWTEMVEWIDGKSTATPWPTSRPAGRPTRRSDADDAATSQTEEGVTAPGRARPNRRTAGSATSPTPERQAPTSAGCSSVWSGWCVTGWLLCNVFLAFAYYPEWFLDSKILIGVLALIAGVGGAYLFFCFLNMFVEGLPGRLSRGADAVRLSCCRRYAADRR